MSPLLHNTFKVMGNWQENLRKQVEAYGSPPLNFIPGSFVDNDAKGLVIHKYYTILLDNNTPFSNLNASALPAKRLWNYLVQQESVQDIFVRAVFGKKHFTELKNNDVLINHDIETNSTDQSESLKQNTSFEPIRIIHKDQETITAFCINKVEPALMTLATPRELQEIDVSLLLNSTDWIEDECELDILNLNKNTENNSQSSYLIIQTPKDL